MSPTAKPVTPLLVRRNALELDVGIVVGVLKGVEVISVTVVVVIDAVVVAPELASDVAAVVTLSIVVGVADVDSEVVTVEPDAPHPARTAIRSTLIQISRFILLVYFSDEFSACNY